MGWLLVDRYRFAVRNFLATRDLAFLMFAPGGMLCAVAYWKWRKENRRG